MNRFWLEKISVYLGNIWFLWMASLILNIITFLSLFFKLHPSNQTLALRYNVLAGIEEYGAGKNLYWLPAVGFIMLVVNFFIWRRLSEQKNFLPFLPVLASLCVQIVLLIATLMLIRVN